MFIKFSLLFFLLSLSSLFCFSQNDSIQKIESIPYNNRYYSVGTEQAKALYKNELLSNYVFLNGREYKLYHVRRETSPLFGSSLGLEGTIFVDGESYPDVVLIYDIFIDKLVYITPSRIFKDCNFIEINQTIVDSFFVEVKKASGFSNVSFNKQYHFVKINFPGNSNITMKDGYYEVADCGEMKLFVQHKAIQVSNQGADAMQNGLYKYVHILNKTLYLNGNYYEINKKRKFIKLFPDKRKAINKKLKSFALRFDMLNKEQLVETLQFINSI
jgi:hypothetical protein